MSKADLQPTINNCNSCWHSFVRSNCLFNHHGSFNILRVRHSMRNNSRLECDNWLSIFNCLFYIWLNIKIVTEFHYISSFNSNLILCSDKFSLIVFLLCKAITAAAEANFAVSLTLLRFKKP